MPVTFSDREKIAAALDRDKPNLFSLADEVISAAPERQWGVWVVDYRRAHFLGEFLQTVYGLSGAADSPQVIGIANSRNVRGHYQHQWAVGRRLAAPDLGVAGSRALIISEYAKSRVGLGVLARSLHMAGALAVDAAVLNLDYPGSTNRQTDLPDNIYRGKPCIYEPSMYRSPPLVCAIGKECVLGQAEPVDARDPDIELTRYVTDTFVALAHEYVEGCVAT